MAAAAGVTVDRARLELDVPIPGSLFDDVEPWIPSLNIVGNENNPFPGHAFQAIVRKEKNIGSTSKRRGRSMKAIDRRRLEASIPPDAHRGLRMLCSGKLLDIDDGIDCPVNTTANEFACAKLSGIRLDVSTICLAQLVRVTRKKPSLAAAIHRPITADNACADHG